MRVRVRLRGAAPAPASLPVPVPTALPVPGGAGSEPLTDPYAGSPTIDGCPIFPKDNAWNTDIDTALGLFLQSKDVKKFQSSLESAASKNT